MSLLTHCRLELLFSPQGRGAQRSAPDSRDRRPEFVLTCAELSGHLPAETGRTSTSFTIFEGTSEIQRVIIGRAVTGLGRALITAGHGDKSAEPDLDAAASTEGFQGCQFRRVEGRGQLRVNHVDASDW